MESADFWQAVALVGGYPPANETEAFDRLIERLSGMDPDEITSFEDRLAEVLYDLDRSEFAEIPIIDTGREQSNDSFLYKRCAVVLGGEAAYRAVISGDRSFQDFTHSRVPSSERLLYVAQRAFEKSTGKPWTHVSPLDYETGTNSDYWQ